LAIISLTEKFLPLAVKYNMKATYHKYNQFKRPSELRGVMTEKETWFIVLEEEGKTGIGECGILRGLSIDDRPDYEENYNGPVLIFI
jgi:hypothetical protein